MPVVLRHQPEGFAEELELSADGTFRCVCSCTVIHGGQYDEDYVTETYSAPALSHGFLRSAFGSSPALSM